MSHYRTGLLTVTNGSTAVIGAGTDFISGAAIGECVQAPDGKLYEILSIQSATALTLGAVYLGATASGQAYSIVPTQSYIRDLASQAATLVNGYSDVQAQAIRKDAADKATIVDADKLGGRDSVSGLAKLFSFSTIKTALASWLNGGTLPIAATSLSASGTVAIGANKLSLDFFTNSRLMAWGANTTTQGSLVVVSASSDASVYTPVATFSPTGINAAVIGATTPAAGSFTTLSAASTVSAGTAGSVDGSMALDGTATANPHINFKQNSVVRATVQYLNATASLNTEIAGVTRTSVSSAGLAVTGGISATGALTTAGIKEDAAGNLLVGVASGAGTTIQKNTNTAAAALSVNASAATVSNQYGISVRLDGDPNTAGNYFFSGTGYATTRIQIQSTGNVVNTNNSYGAISDLKLKENITDATPKLAKLMQVRIVNYNLKTDPLRKQIGVIAQELELISPGLIEEMPDYIEVTKTREVEVPEVPAVDAVLDADGVVITPAVAAIAATTLTEEYTEREATGEVTKSVKYSVFVPMLIKAMQEQQAQIEALTARLTTLETA